MAKSPHKIAADKIDRFLAKLDADAECFGLIGKGYPNSLYKVFVRPKPGAGWWRFEIGAGPSKLDPIAHQAGLAVATRATAVWLPLAHLTTFKHHPERTSIRALIKRASEVSQTTSA